MRMTRFLRVRQRPRCFRPVALSSGPQIERRLLMKVYNPPAVHAAATYSHGIEVPPNARWLHISGQIGIGPDGKMKDGIEAQTQQVWENIKAVLAAAGMGIGDLVKITTYLTD